MEGNNNNNTKTTKTATTLLTLVLVASFAGTMISMPQMIGSVNAQSSNANACPAGFTLKQGKCTQLATCQDLVIYAKTGGPFADGTCTYTCIDPTRCGTSTATVTAICPNGGIKIGDQCEMKPGNRT
jgi:hypothetical protein